MTNSSEISANGPTDEGKQEAARWFVRAREGLSQAEASEYAKWLNADPANRTAFERAEAAWTAVGRLGSSPEVLAFRSEVLNNTSRVAAMRRPWPPRGLKIAAGIAGIAMLGAGLGFVAWMKSGSEWIYQTAPGERRVVALPDGSRLSLDEDSRVAVVYRALSRELRLIDGQAEFRVAKNHLRPFYVEAGGEHVVATGTVFNVDLLSKKVIVTLVEGHVRVTEQGGQSSAAIELEPSERLIVDHSAGSITKTRVDVEDVEAWKLGKLVFDGEPLESATERMNRYARHKIVILGRAERQAPITGVFKAGDSQAFAEAVSAELSMRIERTSDGDILLVRA